MKIESDKFKTYNKQIHAARIQFLKSPGINFFMTEMDPKKLLSFLIVWTSASIEMTNKVESWIKRAGIKCDELNFQEVGSKLKYHAQQEADHDKMLVEDLNFLLKKWNDLYSKNLTAFDLQQLISPSETQNYIDLHEAVISSSQPYCQTAIEFEIERISVVYGPRMIENILHTLGEDFSEGISFLAEHVLLDQGHTKFNIDLMEKCFTSGAEVESLASTGSKALRIYAGFLNQCTQLSQSLLEGTQWTSQLTT